MRDYYIYDNYKFKIIAIIIYAAVLILPFKSIWIA